MSGWFSGFVRLAQAPLLKCYKEYTAAAGCRCCIYCIIVNNESESYLRFYPFFRLFNEFAMNTNIEIITCKHSLYMHMDFTMTRFCWLVLLWPVFTHRNIKRKQDSREREESVRLTSLIWLSTSGQATN